MSIEGEEEGKPNRKPPARRVMAEKPSARQVIAERIAQAAWFYEQPHVVEAIEHSVNETLKWLKANKYSFDLEGVEKQSESRCKESLLSKKSPWWVDLPLTKDPVLLHTRRRHMESKCFENGIRNVYENMDSCGVCYPQDPKDTFKEGYDKLKKAVEHRTMAVHYQLVAFEVVKHPPLKLADLAKRFDYEKSDGLRNRMLVEMAELGLWHASVGIKNHNPFDISIGPIANTFHVNALFPAIQHFSQNKYLGKDEA